MSKKHIIQVGTTIIMFILGWNLKALYDYESSLREIAERYTMINGNQFYDALMLSEKASKEPTALPKVNPVNKSK